ncbi:uncharacterized protein HMPREF1120_04109 [Exophiala dermatitidis NIH/UT8656]|uniref:Uncharacterized protein n=1 Tax=Exophiala dermatitidis (strain ATCC 34100 / CBS 525.76 / NIH/UT8656) TaxID=858893 RepID=H6BW32_EXODN|nr:uncharacterized protein HMPREF1120_04109 [Exophiala dermatitidis NIH/UT8656]EHY56003.1 hypothetical protein HMPREF1120_04109 [Exophiala dermatitidis NIH/UT8656]
MRCQDFARIIHCSSPHVKGECMQGTSKEVPRVSENVRQRPPLAVLTRAKLTSCKPCKGSIIHSTSTGRILSSEDMYSARVRGWLGDIGFVLLHDRLWCNHEDQGSEIEIVPRAASGAVGT